MCLGIVSGGLGHLDPWILSWSQLLESPGYAGALSVNVRGCSFHRTERKLLRWLGGHDERLGCAPRGHPPVGLEPARRGRKGGTNMMDSHFETEVVLLAVTTAGGPTHGGAKMTVGRSPPQLCFSLSWLDSSSTAAALTFRSLCIGALRARLGHRPDYLITSLALFTPGG
jgi:hypothetical protein